VTSWLWFTPDSRTLATASSDRTVKLWDRVTGQERLTLRGHTASILLVAFSPESRTLVTGDDRVLRLWTGD
jgi:eukaryotic-like serine/threonine-protein kinase